MAKVPLYPQDSLSKELREAESAKKDRDRSNAVVKSRVNSILKGRVRHHSHMVREDRQGGSSEMMIPAEDRIEFVSESEESDSVKIVERSRSVEALMIGGRVSQAVV